MACWHPHDSNSDRRRQKAATAAAKEWRRAWQLWQGGCPATQQPLLLMQMASAEALPVAVRMKAVKGRLQQQLWKARTGLVCELLLLAHRQPSSLTWNQAASQLNSCQVLVVPQSPKAATATQKAALNPLLLRTLWSSRKQTGF